MSSVFEDLVSVDVSKHIEQKKTGGTELSYLSWAWAWAYVKKRYPEATYSVWKDERNRPYVFDEGLGYMVFTSVTIEGLTHEMWLPVMDGANHAMRDKPYTIKTKYKEIPVEAATMFDINKTIMRCLVKNIGVFGLGLNLYAGSDLIGIGDDDEEDNAPAPAPYALPYDPASSSLLKQMFAMACDKFGKEQGTATLQEAIKNFGKSKSSELTYAEAYEIIKMLK